MYYYKNYKATITFSHKFRNQLGNTKIGIHLDNLRKNSLLYSCIKNHFFMFNLFTKKQKLSAFGKTQIKVSHQ